jgi:hypothetical protein
VIVRLNIENFRFGARYYTYTLTGIPNTDFSRKVYVNGMTSSLDAGGPENYQTIKANSSIISDEIRIKAPPLSVIIVLVEPGNKELIINDKIVGINDIAISDNISVSPNPSHGHFSVSNIPGGINRIELLTVSGRLIYSGFVDGTIFDSAPKLTELTPGIYIIRLKGKEKTIIKKLIVINP